MYYATNGTAIQIKAIRAIIRSSLYKSTTHRSSRHIHRCFHLISRRVDNLPQKGITFE